MRAPIGLYNLIDGYFLINAQIIFQYPRRPAGKVTLKFSLVKPKIIFNQRSPVPRIN